MNELYEKGLVWMNPASGYNTREHNQAIRDDERVFVFKGGYRRKGCTDSFYTGDTIPEDIAEFVRDQNAEFIRIPDYPRI